MAQRLAQAELDCTVGDSNRPTKLSAEPQVAALQAKAHPTSLNGTQLWERVNASCRIEYISWRILMLIFQLMVDGTFLPSQLQ